MTGVGAAAVALFAVAPNVQAAPFVDVTYDLSDSTATSTIPILSATTSTPPNGTLQGTQTLRYTSDSGGNIVPGPVDLISFNLTLSSVPVTTVNYTGTITLNTSTLHIEFVSLTNYAATGQLQAGGTITPAGANGRFRLTGTVHCFYYCALLKLSASQPTPLVPKDFTAPLPTLTGAVGPSHTVRGTAHSVTFTFQPQGNSIGVNVYGTTLLVGREINRTVPEPSTFPLLAAGLAGLGFAGAAWRRRGRV